jgi:hypothetical protein
MLQPLLHYPPPLLPHEACACELALAEAMRKIYKFKTIFEFPNNSKIAFFLRRKKLTQNQKTICRGRGQRWAW